MKPVIGIVGSIGAGKSAATAAFARRGGFVIDADRLGHEALEVPSIRERLIARWGVKILKPEGSVNRRALANIVFQDANERKALEELVYPFIGERVLVEIAKGRADSTVRFVVLDAAVMIEAGWQGICDRIVFLDAPISTRLARLAQRSGWTAEELTAREAAQMPLKEKKAFAHATIINDGTLEQLQIHVDRLLAHWGF